jgi:TonB family protein
MKNDDFAGGLLEYEAALSIKDDAGVREKLSRIVVPKEWSDIVNAHAAVSSAPKESKGPDFTTYMTNLQAKIKSRWHPPRQPKSGSDEAEVTFKVASSGQASEVKITKSTGLADADQAALKAVADAAPFSALPAGSPSSVDVQFTFTYTERKAGASHQDAAHWRQRVAALEQSGGKNLALALVKLADCDESDGRYAQAEPLYMRALR